MPLVRAATALTLVKSCFCSLHSYLMSFLAFKKNINPRVSSPHDCEKATMGHLWEGFCASAQLQSLSWFSSSLFSQQILILANTSTIIQSQLSPRTSGSTESYCTCCFLLWTKHALKKKSFFAENGSQFHCYRQDQCLFGAHIRNDLVAG